MEGDKKIKYLKGFTISATLAVILIALLTVSAGLYKPLKEFLTQTFYHHWIAKGVLSFATFLILGMIMNVVNTRVISSARESRLVNILIVVTIISALLIIVFYTYKFFA